jgi:hypothetical protein
MSSRILPIKAACAPELQEKSATLKVEIKTLPADNGTRGQRATPRPDSRTPSPSRFMKPERSASHLVAYLNLKATPNREAQRNARIIKCRGNWGRGQRGGKSGSPKRKETRRSPTKSEKKTNSLPWGGVGGGDDDDDKGVDKAAFQGSGSSHHLAAAESESNNRLSRDS